MSDIGSTPSLEPVTEDNIVDLIASVRTQTRQQDGQKEDGRTEPQTDSPALVAKAAKEHSCGFCGSVFKSYPALVEHRATHGGSRPYECHVCDKRFTQKAHLIIHRRTHTGEKPYACHICHKRFSQTSHLNSHKRVHTGEKPFFCSLCSMGFCRRQRLEAHLQQHAKDMQQGLPPHSAVSETSGVGLAGDAKDLLVSLGLGSAVTMESSETGTSGGDTVGAEGRESGSSASAQVVASQMAVFPGFNMGGAEDEENVGEQDSLRDDNDSHRASQSPTPSSSSTLLSQASAIITKSRRKPTFVRKLGAGQSKKRESRGESNVPEEVEENVTDPTKVTLSAQEAAVKAMIRMATGSDCDDIGDVSLTDVTSLDASISSLLKQNFVGAGVGSSSLASTTLVSPSSRTPNSKFSPDSSLGRNSSTRPSPASFPPSNPALSSLIRTNTRVSLVDFTADDLLRHLMSRDDVYRCDFCCVIFHDAAMYHLHRSMHDKMDIRCCNLCGKLLTDKYDFTAHFLTKHR